MAEIAIRFVIGGFVVSAFALLSDLLKPKTFAGLFGAAPSVALASLVLTAVTQGQETAMVEARSMMIGATALLVYASVVSRILLRFRVATKAISLSALLLWLVAAIGLWYALLGGLRG